MVRLVLAGALLFASWSLSAQPYPSSVHITGATFDTGNIQTRSPGNNLDADGSDLWPITWCDDDKLYMGWGDGDGFESPRRSIGVATATGSTALNWNAADLPYVGFVGKPVGMLCIDGVIYMSVVEQDTWVRSKITKSTDYGQTWDFNSLPWHFDEPDGAFSEMSFVNFGQDYAGARDTYVYALGQDDRNISFADRDTISMGRVPRGSIQDISTWEYFDGFDGNGNATWTSNIDNREPIFTDPGDVWGIHRISYNAGLGRYLLTVRHNGSGGWGIFDAAEPWGPWTTVFYTDTWIDSTNKFGMEFNQKWTSTDGKEAYMAFSGVNVYDRWNLVKVTFTTPVAPDNPVVPGTGGFGMDTPAGRGGTVYRVTSLASSGTGTLDACLDASGPRVCIFDTSGTIDMNGGTLRIDNPYITVAGQTAPFPGIQIRAAYFDIVSHDVLVQHLRIRTGSDYPLRDRSTLAMVGSNAYNIVSDHNTIGWNHDEGTIIWSVDSTPRAHDITIHRQLSHPELDGWEGGTRCWLTGAHSYNVSFVKSACANSAIRQPMNAGNDNLIVVNNVMYNSAQIGQLTNQFGAGSHDNSFVGNHYQEGPSTRTGGTGKPIYIDMSANALKLYLRDNIAPYLSGADQWGLLVYDSPSNSVTRGDVEVTNDRITWPAGLVAAPGNTTLSDVTSNVGAFPASRDSQEIRVINNILNGTSSGIVSNVSQLGGFPTYAVNTRTHVLPDNHASDDDGDGYTNLEEWLHCWARIAEGTLPEGSCDDSAPPPQISAHVTAPGCRLTWAPPFFQCSAIEFADDCTIARNQTIIDGATVATEQCSSVTIDSGITLTLNGSLLYPDTAGSTPTIAGSGTCTGAGCP